MLCDNPRIFSRFLKVKKTNPDLLNKDEIKSGFALKLWIGGGDILDVNSLIQLLNEAINLPRAKNVRDADHTIVPSCGVFLGQSRSSAQEMKYHHVDLFESFLYDFSLANSRTVLTHLFLKLQLAFPANG